MLHKTAFQLLTNDKLIHENHVPLLPNIQQYVSKSSSQEYNPINTRIIKNRLMIRFYSSKHSVIKTRVNVVTKHRITESRSRSGDKAVALINTTHVLSPQTGTVTKNKFSSATLKQITHKPGAVFISSLLVFLLDSCGRGKIYRLLQPSNLCQTQAVEARRRECDFSQSICQTAPSRQANH